MVTPRRKIAVLLTASVHPKDVPWLKRVDPSLRRADYLNALRCVVAEDAVDAIIFCENTGEPAREFRELIRSAAHQTLKSEIISFSGQDGVANRGKGYGEMAIIERALISDALDGVDYVLKITGRLVLVNLRNMLSRIRRVEPVDVMCDLRSNLTSSDSRVFCATPTFLSNYLLPQKEIIYEPSGIYFEHALARAVHKAMSDGKRWAGLPVAHRLSGFSGTANAPLHSGGIEFMRREVFRFAKHYVLSR